MSHTQSHGLPPAFGVGFARCLLLVTLARGCLRLRGFRRTLEWVREHVADQPMNECATPEQVQGVATAVATAAAFFPGRARCLEQSLVLYYILRRAGVAVRHRFGVQPYGFIAHAWVEYRGQPINERGEVVRRLALLPDLLP
jgi:hypothetical protein